MKLSTKIILPIILISALLILLNGCFGIPADESPGYTPGSITGIIAAPCCPTSAEPVSETCCIAPEYWCFYCQKTWSLQDGIEVVLTYGEDEVATTTTNQYGEFTFTDVSPGKNYVITAYCPDFDDNRPLVKDVALELIEGGSFDTNITDLVSTSLGLVVDFLVLYTEWGPEDISLDEVLADRPNFPSFPKFKKLVLEVRRVVENCEVSLLTDDDVQDALCRAAEEISGLDIGCGPGYTPGPGPGPGPGPTPDPCAGNTAPVVNKIEYSDDGINFTEIIEGTTIHVISGESYTVRADVSDDGTKDPLTFQVYLDGGGLGTYPYPGINVGLDIPLGDWDLGSHTLSVEFYDGCTTTTWGPVTVVVDPVTSFSITKTVLTQEPYYVGSSIQYQIVVTNNGNTTITPVVTDDKGTYVSGPAEGTASIAPGATWTFIYQATPDEEGDFTNCATATVDPVTEEHCATVTVVPFKEITIYNMHANLAREPGTDVWDLHVWAWIHNTTGQDFPGKMKIRSYQESGNFITKWYPATGEESISIAPGKNRYPSGNDYWLMESVGEGSNKPKDVFVEIWIYDEFDIEVAYASKYAN